MRIYEETYGCTMNQGDTEIMMGQLENSRHRIVEEIDDSDIVLINTCTVKRTTLNRVLYRLKELNNTDKKVIVAGCLPLVEPEKIKNIGKFSAIISCKTTDRIDEVVDKISHGEENIEITEGESDKLSPYRYRKDEISAPIPISEGCTSNCTYCCVKFARGNIRSFKPEEIIRRVQTEINNGRKEIYITAQDTAAYGIDIDSNLAELLDRLTSIPDRFKIRVGMMNPKHAKRILKELTDSFKEEEIYKFLHLPVQSGNDRILRKMKRSYTVDDFRTIVKNFRKRFSNLYLATDIIVGFPSESKEEFRESCDLMKEIKPDKINITRFTPMARTEAKKMEQIKSEEKKRRSKKMTNLHQKIGKEKNERYVGDEVEGLVIKKGKKGGYAARMKNYKPVIVEETQPGKFIKIKITEAETTYLKGEKIEVIN